MIKFIQKIKQREGLTRLNGDGLLFSRIDQVAGDGLLSGHLPLTRAQLGPAGHYERRTSHISE